MKKKGFVLVALRKAQSKETHFSEIIHGFMSRHLERTESVSSAKKPEKLGTTRKALRKRKSLMNVVIAKR